ncbi:anaphase-promoting complex subunit cdc27, partial [Coemansia sp. RSA 1804]
PPLKAVEAIKAPAAAATTHTLQSNLAMKQSSSDTQPSLDDGSSNSVGSTLWLTRPQNEATRCYYERLIARGISLLQPHSVLFVAETYHGWYHHASADMAGNILHQTIGYRRVPSGASNGDAYDIRSVYWLALCYWHLGEVSTVYSLLVPLIIESESILDGGGSGDADADSAARSASSNIGSVEISKGTAVSSGDDISDGEGCNTLLSVYEPSRARTQKALACALWLLAMSCTRLEKWQEAEDYLTMLTGFLKHIYLPDGPGSATGTDVQHAVRGGGSLYVLPTYADVSDLLGLICMRTNRIAQSEIHSVDALQRNPLLWSSCRRLCELGSAQGISKLLRTGIHGVDAEKGQQRYRSESEDNRTPVAASRQAAKQSAHVGSEQNDGSTINSSAIPTSKIADAKKTSKDARQHIPSSSVGNVLGDSLANSRLRSRLGSQTIYSGSSIGSARSITGRQAKATAGVKGIGSRAAGGSSNVSSFRPGNSTAQLPTITPRNARIDVLAGTEKKRTRNGSIVKSGSTSRTREQSGESIQGNCGSSSGSGNKHGGTLDARAVCHLGELVKLGGVACLNMVSFHAPEALVAFSRLPAEQQNSAWGLCMLGRICFEAGRYPEAAQAFAVGHRLAPFRVRDMDTYSTLLWHMKREESLAQLAHAMVSVGRAWSPEAWIAVANCFSLDGDHASALKSLARSIQLYKSSRGGIAVAPRSDSGGVNGLAYAHTLVGHENVASGEFDRAQQAFRTALRTDPRHYNAWYGMGMSYLRLGKLDLAEYHFKRSLALNSQNPLLLQSAGALYEHRGDFARALGVYERVERMLQQGYSIDAATAKLNDLTGDDDKGGSASVTDEGIVLGLQQHHAMNFVLFKRARVLVILERFREAAVILEKLLQRCPREFNVPFLLGQTYTKLRRYREAAACLSRAADIAPENIQSVREAFDALYMQNSDEQEHEDRDSVGGSAALPTSDAQNRDGQAGDLETPSARLGGMGSVGSMLSSGSSVESPYFESPSMYAGRRGQMDWRSDWNALNHADDRVDRALDFDV